MKKATLYKNLGDKKVQCLACQRYCKPPVGKSGYCGVRRNVDGELNLLVHGKAIAVHTDPIEKKPLFHFMPGSDVFSFGTIGCNFRCSFCQNWDISQATALVRERYKKPDEAELVLGKICDEGQDLPPKKIVEYCVKNKIPIIAYTYNEPTIFAEYAGDTALLARKKGIKNVFVSNGYESKECLDYMKGWCDAINIDIKSFSEDFYMKVCGAAKLSGVLTWCGGCGNYAIQNALKRALVLEGIPPDQVLLCYDIGCNGNDSDKFEAYTIHGLHGRVISLASGAAVANSRMKVIAHGGDGGTFSEGVGHLVHAIRNDYPVLFVHHNNENYGLTVGQASSLTRKGVKMNGTPHGVILDPINPLDFVLTLDPSFVARGYSGKVDHLTEVFRLALKHKGFAFVDVLQACPTYNRETPDHWFAERVKDIENLKEYDRADVWQARKVIQDREKEIYLGLLYENENRANFFEMQNTRDDFGVSALVDEVKHYPVGEFL